MTKAYTNNMHQCLISIIDDVVGIALCLLKGIKPHKADPKHIQPYKGESRFSNLKDWTMDVCNHLAACLYSSDHMNKEHVFVLPEFLDGPIKKWF